MSYADLKEHGTEAAVRAAGKMMQKGKPYERESQDLITLPGLIRVADIFPSLYL